MNGIKQYRKVPQIAGLVLATVFCLNSKANSGNLQFVKQWGEKGTAAGEFDFPIDIAINPSGEIFITDHYNDRIQEFDAEGKFISEFSVLASPGGLAIDAAGNFYVCHFAASMTDTNKPGAGDFVSVYDPAGRRIMKWGDKKSANDGEFDCPGGIAASKDGRIYIADQTNHRVQVFNTTGKFLFKWGDYGNGPGQFGGMENKLARTGGPQFVTIDADGNVWTTESMNCRIQEFTRDGTFIQSWGSAADNAGAFGGHFTFPGGKATRLQGPVSLCFDSRGTLWVTALSGRIQRFRPDGTYLGGLIAGQGIGPGQFLAPHGIAIDSHENLYVIDSFNQRIQEFRPTGVPPGATP